MGSIVPGMMREQLNLADPYSVASIMKRLTERIARDASPVLAARFQDDMQFPVRWMGAQYGAPPGIIPAYLPPQPLNAPILVGEARLQSLMLERIAQQQETIVKQNGETNFLLSELVRAAGRRLD